MYNIFILNIHFVDLCFLSLLIFHFMFRYPKHLSFQLFFFCKYLFSFQYYNIYFKRSANLLFFLAIKFMNLLILLGRYIIHQISCPPQKPIPIMGRIQVPNPSSGSNGRTALLANTQSHLLLPLLMACLILLTPRSRTHRERPLIAFFCPIPILAY